MADITKALVTGGSGFIGSNLVRELVSQGIEVVVVDTVATGFNRCPQGVHHLAIDIRDTAALSDACNGVSHLFHLAALPRVQDSLESPISTHEVNVTGTLSVLEAARHAGVKRVVFSSSAAVYGEQETMPLIETMAADPKSPYGLHKWMGEVMGNAWHTIYGLEVVSLRYFNVYGPFFDPQGSYPLVVGKFIDWHTQNHPLLIAGDGTNTRDYVHVYDVVRANIKAAISGLVGKGESINIGTGIETSVNEIAEIIGGERQYGPKRLEPTRSCASITKADELIDWTPTVSIEKGISDLVGWYRDNQPLYQK